MKTERSSVQSVLTALGIALALAVTGTFVAGNAQGAATRTVHIKDIDFSPRVLKISRGTSVRWSFEDKGTPHNVTSRGMTRFRSSTTKQSGSYTFRFTKAGTYRYICTIHLNMKGTIVVR